MQNILRAKQEERLPFYILAVCFGICFLFLNVLTRIENGISENEEFILFVQGWLTVPMLTALTMISFEKIRRRCFNGEKTFYFLMAGINVLFWFFVIWLLRFLSVPTEGAGTFFEKIGKFDAQAPSWRTGEFQVRPLSSTVLWLIAFLFFAINSLGLFFLRCIKKLVLSDKQKDRIVKTVGFLIPILGVIALLNFSGIRTRDIFLVFAAGILSLSAYWHEKIVKYTPGKPLLIFNVTVIAAVIFLVFEPSFPINRHHQNHYLSPVNDLLSGKSLLADVNCQYGVLVIYFLKGIFSILPMDYQGLSFFVTVLLMAQYIFVYGLLRFLTKSIIVSTAALALVIETNFFATMDAAAAYPSIGPLRFGLAYVLLLAVFLRHRWPKAKKRLSFAEDMTVAIASVWSVETFVYTLATYLSIVTYETLSESKAYAQAGWKVVKKILCAAVLAVFIHVLLALYIYRLSGQWPHWSYYLGYIRLYSSGGFGTMPIAFWSPWLLAVVIPFVSLLILFFRCILKEADGSNDEMVIIAGLTGMSIAQFTYFLGRSHPNNLFHISIPLIVIAACVIVYLSREASRGTAGFSLSFIYGGFFAMMMLSLNLSPAVFEKLGARFYEYSRINKHIQDFFERKPTNAKVAETLYLIDKYVKMDNRIAVFTAPDDASEALILSRKSHVYPVSHVIQDTVLPSAAARILNYNPPFKDKDMVFLSRDSSDFQKMLVAQLQRQFTFSVKEKTPHGIYAIELRRLP